MHVHVFHSQTSCTITAMCFTVLSVPIASLILSNFCKASVTTLSEVFRCDVWDKNTTASWTVSPGLTAVFIRYDKDEFILQEFSDDNQVRYDGEGNLVISAKYRKTSVKHYGTIGLAGPDIDDFQYGNFEWHAKIPSSASVTGVFRVGPLTWTKETTLAQIHNVEDVKQAVVQLAVRKEHNAMVFQAIVYSNSSGVSSTDFSGDVKSDWIASIQGFPDLTEQFHKYELYWTATKLVWLIDDKEIFRMNNSQRIPSQKLPMRLFVLAGPRFLSKQDEGDLVVSSVVVRRSNKWNDKIGNVDMEMTRGLFIGTVVVVVVLFFAALLIYKLRKLQVIIRRNDMAYIGLVNIDGSQSVLGIVEDRPFSSSSTV